MSSPKFLPDKNPGLNSFVELNQIPIELLIYTASGLLLVDLLIGFTATSLILFVLLLFGSVALIWRQEFNKLLAKIARGVSRGHIRVGTVLFLVIATIWFLNLSAAPAHAQFFVNTEQWLRQSFPISGQGGTGAGASGAGGTDLYALVFNTLRAIFVLYLAISLVRVIAAARNDEDWQNLARTPLIILVVVTLGDILASLITGQGTGGGGAP
ncbi:hypothetical protein NIES2119_19655 [[Phormidium ambiguum] IAM M-71]|uniref:Uncharacterized protein n=1 Tax=[Phormidium ambiguum] IAM M-71 TaxID=454136 RepID=A0A1U7IFC0_9CYAN|nr:hypothetical protein [Phormidium ambiguum]OKH35715.1 hypothetical protein NIES2119_19655 [Phormidium ambiguum IAM M-71]